MLIRPPTYRDGPGGSFIIEEPMVYEFKGQRIEVPKGFQTDFASIPFGARNLIPVNGRHKRPAVLHDYLYSKASEHLGHTRKEADKEFLRFMMAVGVRGWKRALMYRAVRLFGGWSWRKR